MISPGDFLVFVGVVVITLIYVIVLHHFISRSEQDDPPGQEGRAPEDESHEPASRGALHRNRS